MTPEAVHVYIVNRNRVSCTKRLVEWLLAAGTERITIIDNDSTYPPLLEWYRSLQGGVVVHQTGENIGPWRAWDWANGMEAEPFVFTDSDVVPPPECPRDLIGKCLSVLAEASDCDKVGPGLRLDNIPTQNLMQEYFQGRSLHAWESQFWTRRREGASCASFQAPIDTTFALYCPHGTFSNGWHNIRLDAPYLVEHTPWYVTKPYSEEETYYRAHANYPGTGHHLS